MTASIKLTVMLLLVFRFSSDRWTLQYFGEWTVMKRFLFQQLVAAPVDGVIVTVLIDCSHTSEWVVLYLEKLHYIDPSFSGTRLFKHLLQFAGSSNGTLASIVWSRLAGKRSRWQWTYWLISFSTRWLSDIISTFFCNSAQSFSNSKKLSVTRDPIMSKIH